MGVRASASIAADVYKSESGKYWLYVGPVNLTVGDYNQTSENAPLQVIAMDMICSGETREQVVEIALAEAKRDYINFWNGRHKVYNSKSRAHSRGGFKYRGSRSTLAVNNGAKVYTIPLR